MSDGRLVQRYQRNVRAAAEVNRQVIRRRLARSIAAWPPSMIHRERCRRWVAMRLARLVDGARRPVWMTREGSP